jgi:hypothetical protein
MSSYQDFKSFYQSNILLFIILLFVIVYLIINWNIVYNGNYFGGEYVRSILITGIVFLIFHMTITWDDNATDTDDEIMNIPKYKFNNNLNNDMTKNDIIAANINFPNQLNNQVAQPIEQIQPVQPNQSLTNKYKIFNRLDLNPVKIPQSNQNIFKKFPTSHVDDDAKLSNRNIFISHKNSSKYGLKF